MITPPLQFENDEYVSHRLRGNPPLAFLTSSLFPSLYSSKCDRSNISCIISFPGLGTFRASLLFFRLRCVFRNNPCPSREDRAVHMSFITELCCSSVGYASFFRYFSCCCIFRLEHLVKIVFLQKYKINPYCVSIGFGDRVVLSPHDKPEVICMIIGKMRKRCL